MDTTLFLMVLISFVWAGFMGAISFMESWLKFKAPGVELAVGLSIGRLIFRALNRMEWIFLAALWLCFAWSAVSDRSLQLVLGLALSGILVLQTAWLLPALDKRAKAVMAGIKIRSSFLHFWFAGLELVKLVLLITYGISLQPLSS